MANSNTSLNGYEFGRSPRTQAPFWGGGSEGAAIDDTGIYTDKTWSSKKISDELAEKADSDDVYTKSEVDALLDDIPAVDAYTKSETDDLLADKADAANVYTKTETDSLLAGKAGVNSVYTKGQTDRLLSDKANVSDVYTKSQTDDLVHGKVDKSELADYAKVTSVYTKSQTYTKTEVDNLIAGAGGGVEIDDTAIVANKTWSSMKIDDEIYRATSGKANSADVYTKSQTDGLLADYAKSTAVYTKSQTYTKTEVDNLISQAGGGNLAKVKLSPYAIQGLIHKSGRSEAFTHNNYYLAVGAMTWSGIPIIITYEDSSTDSFIITGDFFDIPWNETPLGSNYPPENAPYKPFVYGELVIKMCLTNNVEDSGSYFADVILMAESNKSISSIQMDTTELPAVVDYNGGVNVLGTPKSVYVDGSATVYWNEARSSFYRKYEIDSKFGLDSDFKGSVNIDSAYLGEKLTAARGGNQIEIAFRLKSGVAFSANSMVYLGSVGHSRARPLTARLNGFVYNDSTYFSVDSAGCIMLTNTDGTGNPRIYLGFNTNYTTNGNEIVRFSYLAQDNV